MLLFRRSCVTSTTLVFVLSSTVRDSVSVVPFVNRRQCSRGAIRSAPPSAEIRVVARTNSKLSSFPRDSRSVASRRACSGCGFRPNGGTGRAPGRVIPLRGPTPAPRQVSPEGPTPASAARRCSVPRVPRADGRVGVGRRLTWLPARRGRPEPGVWSSAAPLQAQGRVGQGRSRLVGGGWEGVQSPEGRPRV